MEGLLYVIDFGRTHDSQTPACEKRCNPVSREFAKSTLHNICFRELVIDNHSLVTTNGIQDF